MLEARTDRDRYENDHTCEQKYTTFPIFLGFERFAYVSLYFICAKYCT